MTGVFTRSIWDQVRPHTWKYRPRTRPVDAILWHCTRGGQWYPGRVEGQAARNWFMSPNNRIAQPPYEPYAGIAHVLIDPDGITEVVPIDHYIPAWSSHPSDEHAISVEVAQSNPGQPIEPETIANCRRFAEWARHRYSIPARFRVRPTNDLTWSGEAGHEDTIQGRAQGKTDPGGLFWQLYLAEDEPMTPEERALVDNLAARNARLERILAANGITIIDADGAERQLTGEQALAEADRRGWSAFLGLYLARRDIAGLQAARPEGPVPDHTHEPGGVIRS